METEAAYWFARGTTVLLILVALFFYYQKKKKDNKKGEKALAELINSGKLDGLPKEQVEKIIRSYTQNETDEINDILLGKRRP